MKPDKEKDVRAAAERRVRQSQERHRTALIKWQQAEREKDVKAQRQALSRLADKEAGLREQRRLALEREDRRWQQERDRLGNRTSFVPVLGIVLPQRNLANEYEKARATYLTRREQVKDRCDQRLTDCRQERTDKLHEFQMANQARDRNYLEARIDLADRQNKNFERLVSKEMERMQRGVSEEFARRGRAREHYMNGRQR